MVETESSTTHIAEHTKARWVLVTGGSRGIGRGIVESLARAGYDVMFTYQQSQQAAEDLEAAVRETGGMAVGYRCDSGNEVEVRALSERLLAERGAPYAIVNNVGITRDSILMQMTSDQWREVINTNLNSAFFTIHGFITAMIEQGDGVILQMASVTALKGNPGQTNYAATKAALVGMTRSLALEVARFNIRVNALAPGFITTEMVDKIPEKQLKQIKQTIPLRRFGTVEEVASLARYLVSDQGGYITGQTFVIDGGINA